MTSTVDPEPWQQLGLVVDDLVRARADLAAAVQEAAEAGAELRRRATEVGDLEDVLGAVLGLTDDVVLVVDVGTRRVRAWSAGAVRRFGLPVEDVVGRALVAVRAAGLPGRRLADEVARLGRPAPREDLAGALVVEDGSGRFALHPVPARPARSVVVRREPGSDVHAGPEPGDDAGQPA